MLKPSYTIPTLPPPAFIETPAVLRRAAIAHRHLAEMKGRAASIPNPNILIDTLALQEAKASSEIENIITTQDELFRTSLFPENPASPAAKEVALYRDALRLGFERLAPHNLITNNTIIAMFQVLKRTNGQFRQTPGTALKNEASGELVYIPPQDGNAIRTAMKHLERFINAPDPEPTLDPLVKMAIIHHQFESIHPFPDGNGRIGRIINVLYLSQQGLLDAPILYLSRYITAHKADYYRLLQSVRTAGEWEPWLLYMLDAVAETATATLRLIDGLRQLMARYKTTLRDDHSKIYSQDLLNNIFRHPYTRIEFIQNELSVSRPTATKYLDTLAAAGLLFKHQSGRNNYYINRPLLDLFREAGG